MALVLSILLSTSVFADAPVRSCFAMDGNNGIYQAAFSANVYVVQTQALKICRENSELPNTCKIVECR